MTFEFAWVWLLTLLPGPVLIALVVPRAAETRRSALRFPFFTALVEHPGTDRSGFSRWRLTLAAMAWILLVLAAARPQFVGDPIQVPISGRDLMLAVDISGSMQTEDMRAGKRQTDRLAAVKAVAGDFIARREGDRVGLILFGKQAYLQTPLTFDGKTVRTFLNEAAIGLAGKETAIGDAIGLTVKRLRKQPQENRVLILLTDGANTAGSVSPFKAADLALREGVRIYTIGVGADERIVQGLFGVRRVAGSDLDEHTLKVIAEKTGGRYFRAADLAALQRIYGLLDKLEPLAKEDKTYRPVKELYAWPLSAALLLTLILAMTISGLWRGKPGAGVA